MASDQHCGRCNLQTTVLLRCSRCRSAVYCSAECQRADWKSHRPVCSSQVTATQSGGSSSSSAKPKPKPDADNSTAGPNDQCGKVCWGGELRPQESLQDRYLRIKSAPTEARSYASRFLKAQELFRLAYELFLEVAVATAASYKETLEFCCDALVEGLLLEDKALSQNLALVEIKAGPESCPFHRILELLRGATEDAGPNRKLKLSLLEVQWLDMQMILARELVQRNENNPAVAETHQARWFDLLLKMDELARKAVAAAPKLDDTVAVKDNASDGCSREKRVDKRILSRLWLVQAQYGSNPPISRPPQEVARLAQEAVRLWPEDPAARLWAGREEDIKALIGTGEAGSFPGLLEWDAPQRAQLQKKLQR